MKGDLDGTVVELLSGGLVKVRVDKEELTAHVADEVKRVSVPLRAGDRVKVRRMPHDPTRAKIVGVSP